MPSPFIEDISAIPPMIITRYFAGIGCRAPAGSGDTSYKVQRERARLMVDNRGLLSAVRL